eukprot:1145094-Pelagomonas_calceolata.AAC.2
MSGMHTNRHHVGLSFCVRALSKGRSGSSLIDRFFPYGTGSPAWHRSRPDAIFVRSIPGRRAHLDPSKIPLQDRDIYLVGLKLCSDTTNDPSKIAPQDRDI